MSVKGLTWGSPEFVRIAKLGEERYEAIHGNDEEDDDK